MTLAFAETITSIYFSKRNPYGLLQVQRKNFYTTILRHFFVDLQRRESDKALIILAEKSNKPLEEIKDHVDKLEAKETNKVKQLELINTLAKKIHVEHICCYTPPVEGAENYDLAISVFKHKLVIASQIHKCCSTCWKYSDKCRFEFDKKRGKHIFLILV